jgi:hypothetical protein
MEENRNSSFWDLLIWVTVLGAGTFALEGLCIHFIGKGWIRIVFFLVGVFFLVRESIVKRRKPERVAKVGALTLTEATKIVSLAMSLFPLVFQPGGSVSQSGRILLLLAFFPLGAWGLYGTRRKEEAEARKETYEQLDLFTDYAARDAERKKEDEALEKEKSLQKAMLDIRKKYGSNSIVKGVNMKEESTGLFRNETIGGHRA